MLDLEGLVFDLFADGVVFAVVANVFLLFFVSGDQVSGLDDGVFEGLDLFLEVLVFLDEAFQAGGQAFYFVFEFPHFQRKLSLDGPYLVYAGVDELEVVQGTQLLFYR